LDWVRAILLFLDAAVFAYFSFYAVVNLFLLVQSFFEVRGRLSREDLEQPASEAERQAFKPLVSLIVPAYNEEVTIVDSVRSLLLLNYPAYEIILVNDGSKDRTVEVLKEAYAFVRSDVDYNPLLGASPIRGFYRSTAELPRSVVRLVLVDKHNGGKADAINCGINASQGAYVASMDADSLIIKDALYTIVKPILDDPNRVIAVGGSIGLTNGATVEAGKVLEVGLPKSWIARFQVVEYMRSFIQSRTALGRSNGLLILSGVFAVFQREILIAAGGFLTKHMRSRVGLEYCGPEAETVCEDMEVVVRLHRYAMEHGIEGRIILVPTPTAWTEAPEIYTNLGKQRNRWYRGLLEVLSIHRTMLFRPKYGRIGLFALPYQLFFEAAAPLIETMGYIVLPISWAVGLLSEQALFSFISLALAFNLFLSVGSVLVSVGRVRLEHQREGRALYDYRGFKALLVLTAAGFLSNLGYRQFLLLWQLRGLKDFLSGRKSWDKFARQGFQAGPKPPESRSDTAL
jgi:cellulose synthase/poly-beta-1,6-N-acetylglucosamine synthase-like glycosyltransferase